MIERPILFKGEMVRAILDGRKTQTRRILNPQPEPGLVPGPCHWSPSMWAWWHEEKNGSCTCKPVKRVPAYKGNQLWVRETIALISNSHEVPAGNPMLGRDIAYTEYIADGAPTTIDTWPWKRNILSSIHMPRGASRIQLLVKGVRVERLQDITEESAQKEGLDKDENGFYSVWLENEKAYSDPEPEAIDCFVYLWDSINGKRGFGWRDNPWVWVIEFERIQ